MRVSSGDDNNNSGNQIDPLSKQESIVKIMVESPKEPPNVEFGVAFPQTTVVRIKTEPTHDIEQQQPPPPSEAASEIAVSLATDIQDIQEPIDVNIPRDTTNIFYAYEETEQQEEHEHQHPPQQQQVHDMPEISQQALSATELDQRNMPTGNNSQNLNRNNQSVNIEQDNTHAPDPSQSDNQTTNSSSISSDNSKSSS